MRIVCFQEASKTPKYGWILDNQVGEIQGDIFASYKRKEAQTPLSDVKLLPPCHPTKIVCVGRNYVDHAKELGNEPPKIPLIFMKPPSSIISNGDSIHLPPQSQQVEHEGELVVVIGKRGKNILAENASDHIFGYTIGNDITARDLQRTDELWTRAKGFPPATIRGMFDSGSRCQSGRRISRRHWPLLPGRSWTRAVLAENGTATMSTSSFGAEVVPCLPRLQVRSFVIVTATLNRG